MRLEQIERLLEQVGPILDPYELTYFPGQNVWGIRLDEETDLLVDVIDHERIYLSCVLGAPAGDRARLYELMLTYNFLWQTTGGGRLCLDGPHGNVVLVQDQSLANANPTSLADQVRSFAQTAAQWRRIVLRPDDAPAQPEPNPCDGDTMAIRI